jgi:hypothetical protein
MGQDEKVGPVQPCRPSAAERIARRVAVQRELARLARGVGENSADVAAVFAVIGAVSAAIVLALIYFSLR